MAISFKGACGPSSIARPKASPPRPHESPCAGAGGGDGQGPGRPPDAVHPLGSQAQALWDACAALPLPCCTSCRSPLPLASSRSAVSFHSRSLPPSKNRVLQPHPLNARSRALCPRELPKYCVPQVTRQFGGGEVDTVSTRR
jgi:hypothetical protein